MAGLFKAPTSNFWSTSLNGAINDSVDTITLNSTTGLQAPGYLIINREDSNGTPTPNAREIIKFTGISGSDITGVTRGADSSTARSHSDGSLVESVLTIGMWNDQRDSINAEHDTDGTHSIIAAATITNGYVNNLYASNATITTLNVASITGTTTEVPGTVGQMYWSRSGSLATVLDATATDSHFPLIRVTKNLTVNNLYVSLQSAPSTAAFQCDINFGSTPTGDFASIFSTVPTIDVGEYDTTTAATAAVLSLTSLVSGSLLQFEIDAPGGAGGMGASLQVTSRA